MPSIQYMPRRPDARRESLARGITGMGQAMGQGLKDFGMIKNQENLRLDRQQYIEDKNFERFASMYSKSTDPLQRKSLESMGQSFGYDKRFPEKWKIITNPDINFGPTMPEKVEKELERFSGWPDDYEGDKGQDIVNYTSRVLDRLGQSAVDEIGHQFPAGYPEYAENIRTAVDNWRKKNPATADTPATAESVSTPASVLSQGMTARKDPNQPSSLQELATLAMRPEPTTETTAPNRLSGVEDLTTPSEWSGINAPLPDPSSVLPPGSMSGMGSFQNLPPIPESPARDPNQPITPPSTLQELAVASMQPATANNMDQGMATTQQTPATIPADVQEWLDYLGKTSPDIMKLAMKSRKTTGRDWNEIFQAIQESGIFNNSKWGQNRGAR